MARPPVRIDRREVVTAALAILERDGMHGLTMRRLGEEMGVQGGAFYHHFRDKSEILRAVARFAVAEIDVPEPARYASWQDWVVRLAVNYRGMLVARPYIAPLLLDGYLARTSLPVYAMEREHLMRAGIPADRHETVFDALEAFVLGSAALAGTRRNSRTHPEHWDGAARDPDAERRAAADFELALRVLLDGLVERFREGHVRGEAAGG
jgi:AcrR family transcriptional regulator